MALLKEIAEINPFRYRGYYYDEESKLYYLITRYYDPWEGQFISPDSFKYLDPTTIGGINLYAYREDNSVKYCQSSRIKVSWPDLSFLGYAFGWIENSFSIFAGIIDGYRSFKKLTELKGLEKASNWLMGIGIALNVGLSVYYNLTAPGLTETQRAGNIAGDITYIATSAGITYGVAAFVGMIPVVGPVLGVGVSIGVGIGLDQLWYVNWGGKSIDEYVKEFLTWMFGGFQ